MGLCARLLSDDDDDGRDATTSPERRFESDRLSPSVPTQIRFRRDPDWGMACASGDHQLLGTKKKRKKEKKKDRVRYARQTIP